MSARSFDITRLNVKQSNIKVFKDLDCICVELHGTIVLTFSADQFIYLNSGGYRTPTTKVVINRALEQLGRNERVSQVKGVWYVNGQEFKDGMRL